MSSISSVATSTLPPINSAPGDNGSSAVGGVDFDDVLKQLYAIEDECNKAIGELTQKVEQLAKSSGSPDGAGSTPSVTPDALVMPTVSSVKTTPAVDATTTNLVDLQQSQADPNISAGSLASYVKATQSYTKALVLPDFASQLFATNS